MKKLILLLVLSIVAYQALSVSTTKTLISGLNHPWSVVFLNNNRLLITQRNSDLLLFDKGQKITLDLPVIDIYAQGQGGLLDLALAPDYQTSGWVYMSYSKADDDFAASTALVRFQLKNNKISNYQELYVAKPYIDSSHHFGGRIVFDDKGYVYLSVGDRGRRSFAQNTNNDIGKILRLNPNGTVPKDNPFNNAIYSYGHRNPQGMIYFNQQLIAHEHGPRGGDELNIIKKGVNYGWPIISYGREYITNIPVGISTHKDGMAQPIHYWTPSIAPSGLTAIKQNGKTALFIGSLKFRELAILTIKNNKIQSEKRQFKNSFGRIRDVRIRNNKLYILTDSSDGKLIEVGMLF